MLLLQTLYSKTICDTTFMNLGVLWYCSSFNLAVCTNRQAYVAMPSLILNPCIILKRHRSIQDISEQNIKQPDIYKIQMGPAKMKIHTHLHQTCKDYKRTAYLRTKRDGEDFSGVWRMTHETFPISFSLDYIHNR